MFASWEVGGLSIAFLYIHHRPGRQATREWSTTPLSPIPKDVRAGQWGLTERYLCEPRIESSSDSIGNSEASSKLNLGSACYIRKSGESKVLCT
jgi:hypothetical protein